MNIETSGEILARLTNNMLMWIAEIKDLDVIPVYHNIRSMNKIKKFLADKAPELHDFFYFTWILLRQDLFGDAYSEY